MLFPLVQFRMIDFGKMKGVCKMSTIIISVVLLIIVGAIVASLIRGKKKGKAVCGCSGCSGCSGKNGESGCCSAFGEDFETNDK